MAREIPRKNVPRIPGVDQRRVQAGLEKPALYEDIEIYFRGVIGELIKERNAFGDRNQRYIETYLRDSAGKNLMGIFPRELHARIQNAQLCVRAMELGYEIIAKNIQPMINSGKGIIDEKVLSDKVMVRIYDLQNNRGPLIQGGMQKYLHRAVELQKTAESLETVREAKGRVEEKGEGWFPPERAAGEPKFYESTQGKISLETKTKINIEKKLKTMEGASFEVKQAVVKDVLALFINEFTEKDGAYQKDVEVTKATLTRSVISTDREISLAIADRIGEILEEEKAIKYILEQVLPSNEEMKNDAMEKIMEGIGKELIYKPGSTTSTKDIAENIIKSITPPSSRAAAPQEPASSPAPEPLKKTPVTEAPMGEAEKLPQDVLVAKATVDPALEARRISAQKRVEKLTTELEKLKEIEAEKVREAGQKYEERRIITTKSSRGEHRTVSPQAKKALRQKGNLARGEHLAALIHRDDASKAVSAKEYELNAATQELEKIEKEISAAQKAIEAKPAPGIVSSEPAGAPAPPAKVPETPSVEERIDANIDGIAEGIMKAMPPLSSSAAAAPHEPAAPPAPSGEAIKPPAEPPTAKGTAEIPLPEDGASGVEAPGVEIPGVEAPGVEAPKPASPEPEIKRSAEPAQFETPKGTVSPISRTCIDINRALSEIQNAETYPEKQYIVKNVLDIFIKEFTEEGRVFSAEIDAMIKELPAGNVESGITGIKYQAIKATVKEIFEKEKTIKFILEQIMIADPTAKADAFDRIITSITDKVHTITSYGPGSYSVTSEKMAQNIVDDIGATYRAAKSRPAGPSPTPPRAAVDMPKPGTSSAPGAGRVSLPPREVKQGTIISRAGDTTRAGGYSVLAVGGQKVSAGVFMDKITGEEGLFGSVEAFTGVVASEIYTAKGMSVKNEDISQVFNCLFGLEEATTTEMRTILRNIHEKGDKFTRGRKFLKEFYGNPANSNPINVFISSLCSAIKHATNNKDFNSQIFTTVNSLDIYMNSCEDAALECKRCGLEAAKPAAVSPPSKGEAPKPPAPPKGETPTGGAPAGEAPKGEGPKPVAPSKGEAPKPGAPTQAEDVKGAEGVTKTKGGWQQAGPGKPRKLSIQEPASYSGNVYKFLSNDMKRFLSSSTCGEIYEFLRELWPVFIAKEEEINKIFREEKTKGVSKEETMKKINALLDEEIKDYVKTKITRNGTDAKNLIAKALSNEVVRGRFIDSFIENKGKLNSEVIGTLLGRMRMDMRDEFNMITAPPKPSPAGAAAKPPEPPPAVRGTTELPPEGEALTPGASKGEPEIEAGKLKTGRVRTFAMKHTEFSKSAFSSGQMRGKLAEEVKEKISLDTFRDMVRFLEKTWPIFMEKEAEINEILKKRMSEEETTKQIRDVFEKTLQEFLAKEKSASESGPHSGRRGAGRWVIEALNNKEVRAAFVDSLINEHGNFNGKVAKALLESMNSHTPSALNGMAGVKPSVSEAAEKTPKAAKGGEGIEEAKETLSNANAALREAREKAAAAKTEAKSLASKTDERKQAVRDELKTAEKEIERKFNLAALQKDLMAKGSKFDKIDGLLRCARLAKSQTNDAQRKFDRVTKDLIKASGQEEIKTVMERLSETKAELNKANAEKKDIDRQIDELRGENTVDELKAKLDSELEAARKAFQAAEEAANSEKKTLQEDAAKKIAAVDDEVKAANEKNTRMQEEVKSKEAAVNSAKETVEKVKSKPVEPAPAEKAAEAKSPVKTRRSRSHRTRRVRGQASRAVTSGVKPGKKAEKTALLEKKKRGVKRTKEIIEGVGKYVEGKGEKPVLKGKDKGKGKTGAAAEKVRPAKTPSAKAPKRSMERSGRAAHFQPTPGMPYMNPMTGQMEVLEQKPNGEWVRKEIPLEGESGRGAIRAKAREAGRKK